MYLQTEEITPGGSGILWCCFALGKHGLTPCRRSWETFEIDFKVIPPSSGETNKTLRRTAFQWSSSSRKKLLIKSHGVGWYNRNYERVKMSGQTSAPTTSIKLRPIQVYLRAQKDSFTVRCMSKLWYSPTNSTVCKPIRTEQVTRASD